MKRVLSIIFLVITLLVVFRSFSPEKTRSSFDVESFAQLPVLEGGRYKPLDSVARTSLLLLRGKQTIYNLQGEKISAIEWFMDLTLAPERSGAYEVFQINHADVKHLIGCDDEKRRYFSFSEVIPHVKTIEERVKQIPQEVSLQNASQKELSKLYRNLIIYRRLAYSLRLPLMQSTVEGEYLKYVKTLRDAAEILRENPEGDPDNEILNLMSSYARQFGGISDKLSIKFVPVEHDAVWLNLSEALMSAIHVGILPPVAIQYAKLSDSYISGNVESFDRMIQSLKQAYDDQAQSGVFSSSKIKWEYLINTMQPFTTSMVLYILSLIAIFVAWLVLDEKLMRTVFWMLVIAFLIHSFGMLARMLIQGRPPVTNLYSSAIFVGWGSVALGIVLERIFKSGIGGSVSCITGFMSLIIASHLMVSGDTMEMMRAVLDSNFWLATHVITISMGYSANYIAGFLAVLYIVLGVFTKVLDQKTEKNLLRMVYGIVCFSLLFSFVGTVLGGIWADQSWGRFWGWDPKENGALMIVIWNALILHARSGGLVRRTGFMNLAIFGNIITSWSWFGVNMLGVGLHSYGFMSSAFFWLMIFCFSQLLIMSLAFIPRKYWRS